MESLIAIEEELDTIFRNRQVILNHHDRFQSIYRKILSFDSNSVGKGEYECFMAIAKKVIYLQIIPVQFDKATWNSFNTFDS